MTRDQLIQRLAWLREHSALPRPRSVDRTEIMPRVTALLARLFACLR